MQSGIRITKDCQVMFESLTSSDERENQIDNISLCLILLFVFVQLSFVAHFLRCPRCVFSLTYSTNRSRLNRLSGENGGKSHSFHCLFPFAR